MADVENLRKLTPVCATAIKSALELYGNTPEYKFSVVMMAALMAQYADSELFVEDSGRTLFNLATTIIGVMQSGAKPVIVETPPEPTQVN